MALKSSVKNLFFSAIRSADHLIRPGAKNGNWVLLLEQAMPLGYLVHGTPVFEAIKTEIPQLKIVVATRSLGMQVLRHSPFVDVLIETGDPIADTVSAARGLKQQLSSLNLQPTWIMTNASNRRTKFALLGALATGGRRGGYTLAEGFYDLPLKYDKERSLIDNNLRLAEALGAPSKHYEPRVFFNREELQKATDLMRETNPNNRPVAVLVTQGSGGQRTSWHVERFREVSYVIEQKGFLPVYVGTQADQSKIDELRQGHGVSIAGRTDIPVLAAILAMADIAVTIDTGTMHVGRSVQTPMVIMGPSWQKPVEWMPLQMAQARVLRGQDRPLSEIPENYKLDEVTVDMVLQAFDELVRLYPASSEDRARRVGRALSETTPLIR